MVGFVDLSVLFLMIFIVVVRGEEDTVWDWID